MKSELCCDVAAIGKLRDETKDEGAQVIAGNRGTGSMAHHKRRRAQKRRAGCLFCKPWKMNGFGKSRPDGESLADHRRRLGAQWEIEEALIERLCGDVTI
jgi:hypothetical protein